MKHSVVSSESNWIGHTIRAAWSAIILHFVLLTGALIAVAVLLSDRPTAEREHKYAAMTFLWLGVLLAYQALVSVWRISLTPHGIGRRLALTTDWIAWTDLEGIFWTHAKGAVGAKTLYLQTRRRTICLRDGEFSLGEVPLIDAIYEGWRLHRTDDDLTPFSPPRILAPRILIGLGVTLVTSAAMASLSGIGLVSFSLLELGAFSFLATAATTIFTVMASVEQGTRLSKDVYTIDVDDIGDRALTRAREQNTAPHSNHQAIEGFLRRVFGPKAPIDTAFATESEAQHRFRRLGRRYSARFGVGILAAAGASMSALVLADRWWHPVPPDAVFENGRPMHIGFLIGCLMVSFPASLVAVYLHGLSRERSDIEFHQRFDVAIRGYDPIRAGLFLTIPLFLLGTITGLASWGSRECIDNQGVHFKRDLVASESHSFQEVRGVDLYPQARSGNLKLVIRFRGGVEFRSDTEWKFLRWMPVLEYLHQRTGLPIPHDPASPDDPPG